MSTPETEMPERRGGFLGWVSGHKWWIFGGVGVLGVGIYVYEKHKASTSGSATSTTASALPTGSGVSYPSPPTGSPGGGSGGYQGFAGSVFAGQLASNFSTDVASSLDKYASIRGGGLSSSGSGSSQPAQLPQSSAAATPVTPKAVVGVPAAIAGGKTGTAISPPSSINLKGVAFRPTREVQYENANWYGIPNAGIAAKLKAKGVTVQNILGGKGLYAKG